MTDPLLKYRARAVKFNGKAKANRWIVCIECHRVVGNYIAGETSGLAADLGIDVSQVQNMAMAAKTYLALRQKYGGPESYRYLSLARKKLSASHFTVLGRAMQQYKIGPMVAFRHLLTAVNAGASVRQFRQVIDEMYRDQPPDWAMHAAKAAKYARLAMDDYGVPDIIRSAARDFLDVSEGGRTLPFITLERSLAVYLRAYDSLEAVKQTPVPGKGGYKEQIVSWDRRLARIIRRLRKLVK